jgi:hypothetical protein
MGRSFLMKPPTAMRHSMRTSGLILGHSIVYFYGRLTQERGADHLGLADRSADTAQNLYVFTASAPRNRRSPLRLPGRANGLIVHRQPASETSVTMPADDVSPPQLRFQQFSATDAGWIMGRLSTLSALVLAA